jgi:hypothetical protein
MEIGRSGGNRDGGIPFLHYGDVRQTGIHEERELQILHGMP